ncbi:hypothetical protein HYT84_04780 [Candidatus Micrarchaeota archaeon]|nr:hypothetical protein [Candidatus Micrarchaeota archaeon]
MTVSLKLVSSSSAKVNPALADALSRIARFKPLEERVDAVEDLVLLHRASVSRSRKHLAALHEQDIDLILETLGRLISTKLEDPVIREAALESLSMPQLFNGFARIVAGSLTRGVYTIGEVDLIIKHCKEMAEFVQSLSVVAINAPNPKQSPNILLMRDELASNLDRVAWAAYKSANRFSDPWTIRDARAILTNISTSPVNWSICEFIEVNLEKLGSRIDGLVLDAVLDVLNLILERQLSTRLLIEIRDIIIACLNKIRPRPRSLADSAMVDELEDALTSALGIIVRRTSLELD